MREPGHLFGRCLPRQRLPAGRDGVRRSVERTVRCSGQLRRIRALPVEPRRRWHQLRRRGVRVYESGHLFGRCLPRQWLQAVDHGLPSLDGSMRRGRDLHRHLGRVPAGRLPAQHDHLHGHLERWCVRRNGLLRRSRPLRGRLQALDHGLPTLDGSMRRSGKLHRHLGRVPAGPLPAQYDNLHGHLEWRCV